MQVSSLVNFFTKDVLEVELNRIKSVFRERVNTPEQAFIKFEYIANVLGYIADTACYSGQIRMIVGIVQIVTFGGRAIFHWYYVAPTKCLLYDREIILHGAANVMRGFVESFCSPIGSWLVIAYALSGERRYYPNESKDISINNLWPDADG